MIRKSCVLNEIFALLLNLIVLGDFTPVCTTELGAMAQYANQFAQRGVKLLGLSCDDVQSHNEWIKDIEAFNVYACIYLHYMIFFYFFF